MPTRTRLAAAAALAFAASCASAQAPLPVPEHAPESPKGRKVERIRSEDSRVVIDEVRVGGETQSISVQPKNGMPAYEIAPNDTSRTSAAGTRDGTGSPGGRSAWNIFKF